MNAITQAMNMAEEQQGGGQAGSQMQQRGQSAAVRRRWVVSLYFGWLCFNRFLVSPVMDFPHLSFITILWGFVEWYVHYHLHILSIFLQNNIYTCKVVLTFFNILYY